MKEKVLSGDFFEKEAGYFVWRAKGSAEVCYRTDDYRRWLRINAAGGGGCDRRSSVRPKNLCYLNRDLMQPSLSPLCPLVLVPGMRLKLSYSIFGGARVEQRAGALSLELAGDLPRHQRPPADQPQNGLGCSVKWVPSFWSGVWFWCELNDCLQRTGSAITHRTAPYVTGTSGS